MKVHAEIEYNRVHSDICPDDCKFENITDEYRGLLHACLNEWLDKSRGEGGFYIAKEGYQIENKQG